MLSEPRKVFCTQCDGEVGEIDGLFKVFKALDSMGNVHYALRTNRKQVTEQLAKSKITLVKDWGVVPDNEIIRSGMCSACAKELDAEKEALSNGAVVYQCDECSRSGIIKDPDIAMQIRKDTDAEGKYADVVFTEKDENGNYPMLVAEFTKCTDHMYSPKKLSNEPHPESDSLPGEHDHS